MQGEDCRDHISLMLALATHCMVGQITENKRIEISLGWPQMFEEKKAPLVNL